MFYPYTSYLHKGIKKQPKDNQTTKTTHTLCRHPYIPEVIFKYLIIYAMISLLLWFWNSNRNRNIYLCFIDYAKAFDCVDHNKLWKILKEMGIPDHLTCLLRNLYAGQEATVRTGHGTTDWFQIVKGVCRGCILSPGLFNLYAEYIMRNAGLDEA